MDLLKLRPRSRSPGHAAPALRLSGAAAVPDSVGIGGSGDEQFHLRKDGLPGLNGATGHAGDRTIVLNFIQAIAEARSHGDLSENAEYEAARNQQGFIEGRIREIEAKLSNSQIVDVAKIENTGKVILEITTPQ